MYDLLPSLYAVPITGWADFLEALRVRLRATRVTLAVAEDGSRVLHHAGLAVAQGDTGETLVLGEGVVLSFARRPPHCPARAGERALCEGLRPHVAVVIQLEQRMRTLETLAGVSAELNVEQLIKTFGLTPAEAHVTLLLCRGRSLTEVAGECGRSVETARTHLKRVLAKTQCRRQPELVALVLRQARAKRDLRIPHPGDDKLIFACYSR